MKDNWIIKEIDASTVEKISKTAHTSTVVASILSLRGLNNPASIADFCHPRLSSLYSPFLMKNMHAAVDRIKRAVAKREKIGIFADSDLDGMTSLTILNSILFKLGLQVFYRYIKDEENYGLTVEIINEFHSNNIDLLITVDSGIRDLNEIKFARSLGIDIIITDHHEPDLTLPDAIVINPKQDGCPYPFKHLAGVGVVFKLCHALLFSFLPVYDTNFLIVDSDADGLSASLIKNGIIESRSHHNNLDDIRMYIKTIVPNCTILHTIKNFEAPFPGDSFHQYTVYNFFDFAGLVLNIIFRTTDNQYEELRKMFSLQTIIREKKIEILEIIFFELQLRSSTKIFDFIKSNIFFVAIGTVADVMPLVDENRVLVKEGINYLADTGHPGLLNITGGSKIDSRFISWEIAPLLNTPGRFGRTYLTERFFLATEDSELKGIIEDIKSLNEKRKEMVTALYSEIAGDIDQGLISSHDNMIFVKSDKIPEGLAGLLAHRISENNGKPVIVATMAGNNKFVKGSGRSSINLDFFSYVEPHAGMFDRIGGHAQAFGFTVDRDVLDLAIEKINGAMSSCVMGENSLVIDLEISIEDINISLAEEIASLEPFGKGNDDPVFLSRYVMPQEFIRFGTNNNHGKYRFADNDRVTGIWWNMADIMEKHYNMDRPLDIVYTVEVKSYNRLKYVQLKIIDIHESE